MLWINTREIKKVTRRHSRESGNPGRKLSFKDRFTAWIPAFAGMTAKNHMAYDVRIRWMKIKKIINCSALTFAIPGVCLAAGAGNPLDMTIQGEAQDKIKIERVVPEAAAALKDVVPFSRLGQIDWILSEELGYLDEEKQVAMMDVRSPKTFRPYMIEFPKPPYFVHAYPPPPVPIIVDRRPNAPPLPGEQERWTFIVIDQNNNLLKKIEGNTPPVEPIQWDGMSKNEFVLRTDEIYSSILVIQETPETSRTIVGEPIWMPALRYLKDNKIIFEFSNKRVYDEQKAAFSESLYVLVEQLMNELRKYQGSPFDVVIYDKDLELGQKRSVLWKDALEKNLLRNKDTFNVRVGFPTGRGEITQIILEITK